MEIRQWKIICAVVAIMALGVGLARSSDGLKPSNAEAAPWTAKAALVHFKGISPINSNAKWIGLENPRIQGSWVVGRAIEEPVTVWISLAEVGAISEFDSLDALKSLVKRASAGERVPGQ